MVEKQNLDTPADTQKTALVRLSNSHLLGVIDAVDLPAIGGRIWRLRIDGPRRYIVSSQGRNGMVFLHREIAKATKDLVIDHISGDGLDNRRLNLRACLSRENSRNSRKWTRSKSAFKGVSFLRDRNAFRAQICVNYKKINLGQFPTPEAAAHAYDEAAARHFGQFARLNFPPPSSRFVPNFAEVGA